MLASAPTPAPSSGRLPLVLVLSGALVVGVLLWPFLPAVVFATVLATLVGPAHRQLRVHIRHPGLAALASTAGVVVVFLIPLTLLTLLVGREAARGIEWLTAGGTQLGTAGNGVQGIVASTAERLGLDPNEITALLGAQLQRVVETLAARTVSFVRGIGGWLLQGGAALFTLYYMLRDSETLQAGIRRVVPLDPAQTVLLLARAQEVTHAIVYGNVLVAATQGLLGGLAFAIVGLPAATLWGTIMGVLALIPMVGPPFVYLPASIYLIVTGEGARGLLLAVMGAFVISTVDNLLRALFVGGRAEIHPLVVFFGVLGGLFVFGAAGIIVGPVLFVLALTGMESARMAMEAPSGASLIISSTTLPPEGG